MVSTWYREFMAAAGVNVGSHTPNPRRYTGPPMDLANMRLNGVRSLYAWCLDCGHDATLNVDHLPDHLAGVGAMSVFAPLGARSRSGGSHRINDTDYESL